MFDFSHIPTEYTKTFYQKGQFRPLAEGMGQAVAERTILRKKDGKWENWGDVAHRVALGNSMLCGEKEDSKAEYEILRKHIANGSLLSSGRHLQHGDETQPTRNMEVFSNCSTAPTSFLQFYLLMNGCFQKGTLVKMSDGSRKPIEEITIGDTVFSFDETTQNFVIQVVNEVFINQPKRMVKIHLIGNISITCTFDHKFLTDLGWMTAENLKGRKIVCPTK